MKLRRFRTLLLLLIGALCLLSSLPWLSSSLLWLENKSCSIHKCRMQVGECGIAYGLITGERDGYSQAKAILFPNANSAILGGCVERSEKSRPTLFCAECRRAQHNWSASQTVSEARVLHKTNHSFEDLNKISELLSEIRILLNTKTTKSGSTNSEMVQPITEPEPHLIKAERLLKSAFTLAESLYGPNANVPLVDQLLEQQQVLFCRLGKYREAQDMLKRRIKMLETSSLDNTDPSRLVGAYQQLVNMLIQLGDKGQAEVVFNKYENLSRRVYPLSELFYERMRGAFYLKCGKIADAELMFKKAAGQVQVTGKFRDHPDSDGIDALDELAKFYLSYNRFADAEAVYKRELAICSRYETFDSYSSSFSWFKPYISLLRSQNRNSEADNVQAEVNRLVRSTGHPEDIGLTDET